MSVLPRGRAGSRFADYYRRHRRERRGRLRAALSVLGGVFLVLLGVVLGPTPGPGFVFVLLGAAILAARSRTLARALDSWEIWLRARARRRRKP